MLAVFQASAQSPFDPPPPEITAEARVLVESMIENARGPYRRIAWFCNDGTVHPPQPYACRERGGGRQHAEYSAERQRLAELGWPVGTIFAALEWDELFDASDRHERLRALALERYMIDIDDGWVLRRARSYRGRVQVEDEEEAGRRLLLRLLGNRDWVAQHYLLARESVRVIPHRGSAEDRTRTVRREALELAEREASFEPLRVEIHTAPSAATSARVRAWAERRADEELARAARTLADGLDALYAPAGRAARLTAMRARLKTGGQAADLAARVAGLDTLSDRDRLAALSALLDDTRARILSEVAPETRLLLFDLMSELESELLVATQRVLSEHSAFTRRELLGIARDLVAALHGAGLLTPGEREALRGAWPAGDRAELAVPDYERAVSYLRRLPHWALGSVRYTFAEPLVRHAALDPRSSAFVDDLLRGSALFGLAEVTRRLARDLSELTGVAQSVNGAIGVPAFGLNAGVATGTLRVFETHEELREARYGREDVVLLPETVAELAPVAGIVTLGEGNPLSHVQLLARNFGIPNVAIVPAVLPLVASLEGEEVLVAVASDGSLVLAPTSGLEAGVRGMLEPVSRDGPQLTVPQPDLDVRRPIPLAELEASLSGRIVGPKAANLGELARLFPGRVAPAVALPFGVFAEHMRAGEPSIRRRLDAAYAAHRGGELSSADLREALAAIRRDVAALRLSPDHRERLAALMETEFGAPDGYGLFLRSDTNVEDLPEFTGAGLSETLPNLVGLDLQLDAIPRIWASVLSPRAIAWRSDLLTNPEEVYASVLLMQSVPSEKSGVMVTTDLSGRGAGLTVSTGWGVGGAVAGEAVESLVLRADGGGTLLSEAKTAYRRRLEPAGGLSWVPAADGPVLAAEEKLALRALADEVAERYASVLDRQGRPRPWDIEFGFVGGELTLFQIRPLVERGPALADRIVRALVPQPSATRPDTVRLDARPLTQEDTR